MQNITFIMNNINTLRPRQIGRHFADDIFKCIFLNENVWISIKISLMFVPKGPINNIPPLVQIMARRRSGDKPLSEPMMVSLPTHVCVTRPQWVKKSTFLIKWSSYLKVNHSGAETGIFPANSGQYHCCWCPGSFHCLVISSCIIK